MTTIMFTILGAVFSKANSRRIVTISGKPSSIKSKEALAFEASALKQIPPAARQRLEGPICITLHIFYSTERPDLDESLLLDILQDRYKTVGKGDTKQRVLIQSGCYRNDRQIREKHVVHHIDRANPRASILIEPLQAQQPEMFAAEDVPAAAQPAVPEHLRDLPF